MSEVIREYPSTRFPLERPAILDRKAGGKEYGIETTEELKALDRKRLGLIIDVLNHPITERLIDQGQITLGAIKPNAQDSKLGLSDDVSAEEKLLKYISGRKDTNLEIMFAASLSPSKEELEMFYADVKEKLQAIPRNNATVWDEMVSEYGSGPITYFLLYDPDKDAVKEWRRVIGATDPTKADEGSIRGKFALRLPNNLVHGSSGDTEEEAVSNVKREVHWLREKLVKISNLIDVKESKISRPAAIRKALQENGIEISSKTNIDKSFLHDPTEWLLRSTPDKGPLFKGKMEPKTGDYGTSGVFFTDNIDKIPPSKEEMVVVMRSDIQQVNWIKDPSPEFSHLVDQVAVDRGYDITKTVEAFHAEYEVFRNYPIYQYEREIATFPKEVNMEDAVLILVTPNFLNSEDLNKIPQYIKEKIVKLDYNAA
ncbi:MAG: nucleoside-diphosphate kinase [Candidatus Levybacteria bacterium]|nr:nucleoside-diphosphate kinase [Candidatus Levybacteria bacterium]